MLLVMLYMSHSAIVYACRRGIERIFRKVMQLPNRPAVMYYHFHPAMFGMFKTHYTVGIEDRIEVRAAPLVRALISCPACQSIQCQCANGFGPCAS